MERCAAEWHGTACNWGSKDAACNAVREVGTSRCIYRVRCNVGDRTLRACSRTLLVGFIALVICSSGLLDASCTCGCGSPKIRGKPLNPGFPHQKLYYPSRGTRYPCLVLTFTVVRCKYGVRAVGRVLKQAREERRFDHHIFQQNIDKQESTPRSRL